MRKKTIFSMCIVLVLALSGLALAGPGVWTSGEPNDVAWTTASNWDTAIPTIANGYTTEIGLIPPSGALGYMWPVIDVGMDVDSKKVSLNWGGKMTINGGTLFMHPTQSDRFFMANGEGATAELTMTGGHLDIVSLEMGNSTGLGGPGFATVVMSGGTIDCFYGTKFLDGTSWTMTGGTLNVGGTFVTFGTNSTGTNLAIDLSGDALMNLNNQTSLARVQELIDAGAITAYGGLVPGAFVSATQAGQYDPVVIQVLMANPDIATDPTPSDEATAKVTTSLSWTPSDASTAHTVYMGTDPNVLLLVAGPSAATSYTPAVVLDFDTIYYWRVDETAPGGPYTGNVWQFTTSSAINIDDFEDYKDPNTPLIADSWSSESATLTSGSTVSLSTNPIANGLQAMQLDYDNSVGQSWSPYSETTRTINVDFTTNGVVGMDIWVKGDAANAADNLYVRLYDGTSSATEYLQTFDAVSIDVQSPDWQIARVDLAALGLTLGNIETITIGVGDADSPVATGTGTIYVDDIALFTTRCLADVLPGDINSDCLVDLDDFVEITNSWLFSGFWP